MSTVSLMTHRSSVYTQHNISHFRLNNANKSTQFQIDSSTAGVLAALSAQSGYIVPFKIIIRLKD